MKVRILSGSQTGAVVDLPKTEAEAALSTGFAEAVSGVIEKTAEAEPEEEKEPPQRQKGKREREE